MCDPTSVKAQQFLNQYQLYKLAVDNSISWVNNLIAQATSLQGNQDYTVCLSVDEQNALAANLAAAQQVAIQPV